MKFAAVTLILSALALAAPEAVQEKRQDGLSLGLGLASSAFSLGLGAASSIAGAPLSSATASVSDDGGAAIGVLGSGPNSRVTIAINVGTTHLTEVQQGSETVTLANNGAPAVTTTFAGQELTVATAAASAGSGGSSAGASPASGSAASGSASPTGSSSNSNAAASLHPSAQMYTVGVVVGGMVLGAMAAF
ncbi:hypothetical protein PENSPDRAFT_690976 [Peniophora sp. CONT]|nr:hypothetical protein PENSPDRAFT_690976 [Peniophora sp. CONT]